MMKCPCCSCGGDYVVKCSICGEYPGGIEVAPAGTLDALRGLLPLASQYAEDRGLTAGSPGQQMIEAARAVLDAAGE